MKNSIKKAIVIGSGVAGMACAVRLQSAGFQVLVIEKNEYFGGKLHQFNLEGYRFDAGPSLFTMPQYFEQLATDIGLDLNDFLKYSPLEVVCKYFWEDGTQLNAFANIDDYANEVANKLGHNDQGLKQALGNAAAKYELTGTTFIEKPLNSVKTWLNWSVAKALLNLPKLNVFSSMNQVHESSLKHPKLVQLFNRYATYNGSNPYKAPGILSMIPHLEQHFGAYMPEGGIHDLSKALYAMCLAKGVTFRFNTAAKKIALTEKNQVQGIVLENDEYLESLLIISNLDAWFTYHKLLADKPKLAPQRILNQERSSSALIFYWGIDRAFEALDVHNIFFSEDYKAEFQHLFDLKTLYHDPTVYLHISSKMVKTDAPPGHENWFVMINVPANPHINWAEESEKAKDLIIGKINKILNLDIRPHIRQQEVLSPDKIQSKTGSYLGSLYGSSSNNPYAAFLRHPSQSKIKGLYLCGGSTHPGGGIPLCMMSGKLTAQSILDEA